MKKYIIWPERRWVTEEEINMAYSDSVVNGDIAKEYLNAKDFQTKCNALDDAGILTFGDPDKGGHFDDSEWPDPEPYYS